MSYNDTVDLGQEEGGEEVPEDGVLTLVAWRCTSVMEKAGDGGELARSAAAVEEEGEGDLTKGGAPARFL